MDGKGVSNRIKLALGLALVGTAVASIDRPAAGPRKPPTRASLPVAPPEVESIGGSVEAALPADGDDARESFGPFGKWSYYRTPMQIGSAGLTLSAASPHSSDAVAPALARLGGMPEQIYIARPEVARDGGGRHSPAIVLAFASTGDASSAAGAGGASPSDALPRGLEGDEAEIVDEPSEHVISAPVDGGIGTYVPPPTTEQANPIPAPPAALLGSLGLGLAAIAKRLRAWR